MKRINKIYSDDVPQPSNEKFKFANWLAKRIFEHFKSYQNQFDKTKRIVDKPKERALVEANDIMVFWGYFLSIIFLFTLVVDWDFNRQAFQSQSATGYLVFIFLVCMGLLSSACFNTLFFDFNSKITTNPDTQQYYIITYDMKKGSNPKFQLRHWLTGLIFFIITMFIVYKLSEQRVFWQQALDPNYPDDTLIPPLIFLFTVITGCGMHFILERGWVIFKHKYYENKLNAMQDEIEKMSHKCREAYDQYLEEVEKIEEELIQKNLPIPNRKEANKYLKALIKKNYPADDEIDNPTVEQLDY